VKEREGDDDTYAIPYSLTNKRKHHYQRSIMDWEDDVLAYRNLQILRVYIIAKMDYEDQPTNHIISYRKRKDYI